MSSDTPTSDSTDVWTIDLAPKEFRFQMRDGEGKIRHMILIEVTGDVWDDYLNAATVKFKYADPPANLTPEQKEKWEAPLVEAHRNGIDEIVIAGSLIEVLTASDGVSEIGRNPRPFTVEQLQKMPRVAREKLILKLRQMSGLDVTPTTALQQAKNA